MNEEKKISKVKMLEGGLKGLEIEYLTSKQVEGRTYQVERKEKRKVPVSGELLNCFHAMDQYFKDIACVNNGTVYGLKVTAGGFQLIGEVDTGINNKSINYATPFISEGDDYASFEGVTKALDKLIVEVDKYMKGENKYSDKQIVMQFYERKAPDQLTEMMSKSDDEIAHEAMRILEEKGCIVIAPEALYGEDIFTPAVEEVKEVVEDDDTFPVPPSFE